jgi:arylsulfatase A-like enzyme
MVAEFIVLWLSQRSQFASVWELQFGVAGLLPTVVTVSLVLGAVGAGLWWLLERAEERFWRALLAALVFSFGAVVAYGVGGGRHLQSLEQRWGFALAVGLGAALAGYALAPALSRLVRQRPRLVGWGTLGVVLVLEFANRFVLVRLYPAFHAGLALATLLLAPGLALLVGAPRAEGRAGQAVRSRVRVGALVLITLAAPLLMQPAAKLIAGFDNFRVLMLEQGALLSEAIQITAWLAPPPPVMAPCDGSAAECVEQVAGEPSGQSGFALGQRDLLLITIDALRADHVGAYGYSRPTTPNIDRLAKDGVTFLNAYAPTPHTSYSVTSLMTGKYMRPLLLQEAGQDSDTWAKLLRTYGFRTAAFYPPAIFFIDPDRFVPFRDQGLDFEYRKVEFAEGARRLEQVDKYLGEHQAFEGRLFLWVHYFGPHEPYELQPGFDFGDKDVDRYDSEIAFVDHSVGKLVELVRRRRPNTAVILTADHGEEFGEHGGRYHGTTVYEEQVHVPALINAPGAVPARQVSECVQTIDLLPTVLAALDVPRPPRVRGRNLSGLVNGERAEGEGFAAAETETQTLLAQGSYRLVCARRIGACKLYEIESDPDQQRDVSKAEPSRFEAMRQAQQQLSASHGQYEARGLRAEGKGWPSPILRGVTGDGDAAPEIASLLDDADLEIRRKAAELLFELGRPETKEALRLALSRADDEVVQRWCALALTRLGDGVPLVFDLAKSEDEKWRRLAALALAESGDHRGAATLVGWWRDAGARDYNRSRQILDALGNTRSKDAVWPLVQSLDDVRLRPYIAKTLASIGDEFARGPLVRALRTERYQSSRVALAEALVKLDAEVDLAPPLIKFLGVPDPLPGGLGYAVEAGIVESIGGPNPRTLKRLQRESDLGVAMSLIVPRGGNGTGVRVLARARTKGDEPGSIYLGTQENLVRYNRQGEAIPIRDIPRLDAAKSARLDVPPSREFIEVHSELPPELGARPGKGFHCVVFGDHNVELQAVAIVPLSDELPPPTPQPWADGEQAKRDSDGHDQVADPP